MSDELPEGWASTSLRVGLVSDIQTGFACGKHSRDERGVAHLRPMNVSEAGQIALDDVKYISADEVDREERRLRRATTSCSTIPTARSWSARPPSTIWTSRGLSPIT